MDRGVPRIAALQTRLRSIRAFAPLARRIDATEPTTGYDDVKRVAIVAPAGRQRGHHPGGLGALRAEARAGRAHVRRRRYRFGVGGRRRVTRAAAVAARGDSPEHPRRRLRTGRTRRQFVIVSRSIVDVGERRSSTMDDRRSTIDDACRSTRRRQLSQYAAACSRARARDRSVSVAVRRAREVRGAAARQRRRSRPDSFDRVSRSRLSNRSGSLDRIRWPGRLGGAFHESPDRAHPLDGARYELENVDRASARVVRALVRASSRRWWAWRPIFRDARPVRRRARHRRQRALHAITTRWAWRRSISGRNGSG